VVKLIDAKSWFLSNFDEVMKRIPLDEPDH